METFLIMGLARPIDLFEGGADELADRIRTTLITLKGEGGIKPKYQTLLNFLMKRAACRHDPDYLVVMLCRLAAVEVIESLAIPI